MIIRACIHISVFFLLYAVYIINTVMCNDEEILLRLLRIPYTDLLHNISLPFPLYAIYNIYTVNPATSLRIPYTDLHITYQYLSCFLQYTTSIRSRVMMNKKSCHVRIPYTYLPHNISILHNSFSIQYVY